MPPFLPAALFSRKGLGGTKPGDSTDDFLTEEEVEKPRRMAEKGPGDGEELEAAWAPVRKRGKVSGTPGRSRGGSFLCW